MILNRSYDGIPALVFPRHGFVQRLRDSVFESALQIIYVTSDGRWLQVAPMFLPVPAKFMLPDGVAVALDVHRRAYPFGARRSIQTPYAFIPLELSLVLAFIFLQQKQMTSDYSIYPTLNFQEPLNRWLILATLQSPSLRRFFSRSWVSILGRPPLL
jgi:hypothetical protein